MHAVALPGLTLPLHPRLTVVAGLDTAQRAALAEAVAAAVDRATAVEPALMEELERAHAEVEAAEAALRLVFGRYRSRRRLQAARALEAALLEGMGFATYNEALMAWLMPTDGVPMVVDDDLVTVEADELEPVLQHLLRSTGQVVWATDDPAVVRAADALGTARAAVVVVGPTAAVSRA